MKLKIKNHLASSALTTATRSREQHTLFIITKTFQVKAEIAHPGARTCRRRHNHLRDREINGTANVLHITSATTRFQRQPSWQPGVEPAARSRYTVSGATLKLARRQRLTLRRTFGSFMAIKRWPVAPGYCIVTGGHLPWRFTPGASSSLFKVKTPVAKKEPVIFKSGGFSNAWLSVDMQDHPRRKAPAHCYPTVSWQTLTVCVAVFFLHPRAPLPCPPTTMLCSQGDMQLPMSNLRRKLNKEKWFGLRIVSLLKV